MEALQEEESLASFFWVQVQSSSRTRYSTSTVVTERSNTRELVRGPSRDEKSLANSVQGGVKKEIYAEGLSIKTLRKWYQY